LSFVSDVWQLSQVVSVCVVETASGSPHCGQVGPGTEVELMGDMVEACLVRTAGACPTECDDGDVRRVVSANDMRRSAA
jgi:hypothetical protein